MSVQGRQTKGRDAALVIDLKLFSFRDKIFSSTTGAYWFQWCRDNPCDSL